MSILDRIGSTPLVRLENVGRGLALPILAKCEHLNPSGSVKDRTAKAIVEDAEARGRLRRGDTMIEATAGNTGMGLALMAAVRGYRLVCVLPAKMSIDKRQTLAALGAEVIVTPNAPPDDPDNFQNVARRLASERGWFLTDQFANRANVRVHEDTTGPEILAETAVGAFVAGAGTGGTITGVGRCLRARAPNAKVVLADPIGSGLAGWVNEGTVGPSGAYAIEGIGASKITPLFDRTVIDEALSVSDEESFAITRRLHREEGLLVGGSAGTAVAVALRLAAREDLEGPIVVLLPDSWDRYRSTSWMNDSRRE